MGNTGRTVLGYRPQLGKKTLRGRFAQEKDLKISSKTSSRGNLGWNLRLNCPLSRAFLGTCFQVTFLPPPERQGRISAGHVAVSLQDRSVSEKGFSWKGFRDSTELRDSGDSGEPPECRKQRTDHFLHILGNTENLAIPPATPVKTPVL